MRSRGAGIALLAGALLVSAGLLLWFASAPGEVVQAPVAAEPLDGAEERGPAEAVDEDPPGESAAAEAGAGAAEVDDRDEAIRKVEAKPEPPQVSRLTGRVVDRDGEPVPGASVLLGRPVTPWPLDAPGPEGSAQPRRAKTREDGRFSFEPVPTGVFTAAVRGDGFAPLDVDQIRLSGESLDLGELRLAAAAVLRGRVVDPGDRPVASARLFALPDLLPRAPADLSARNGVHVATTGVLGEFEVRALRPGDWRILVSSTDHPEQVFEGRTKALDGPTEGLVFRLSPGAVIRGHLAGADVAAEEPLVVHAVPLRMLGLTAEGKARADAPETAAGFRRARFDALGAFELTGLVPGEVYGLRVLKPGQPTAAEDAFSGWTFARAGGAGVELSYAPSATLSFVVQNRYDGAPIERFEFRLGGAWPPTLQGEDGRPKGFHPGGRVELRGLRPETREENPAFPDVLQSRGISLRVEAEGHDAFVLEDLTVRSGERAELGALRLTPLPALRVRVVDHRSGQPIEGARVACAGRSAATDAAGLATIPFPLQDVARVVASEEEHGEAEAQVPMAACRSERPFELRLEHRPAPGAVLVQVTDMGANPLREHRVARTSPLGDEETVQWLAVDAAGRATFRVEPGQHGFRTVARPRLGRVESPPVYWQAVDVREGEEVEITIFGQRLEAVRGRLMLDGVPVVDARLRLQAGADSQRSVGAEWGDAVQLGYAGSSGVRWGGLAARTDAAGGFRFEDVAPGWYSLLVDHPASGVRTRLALEADSVEHVLDLDATSIRGTVLDDLGVPVQGARVHAFSQTDFPGPDRGIAPGTPAAHLGRPLTPFATTTTDRFGEYAFDVFPPGLDSCVVVYAGERSGARWTVRPAPGERALDVDVVVRPVATLDVLVDVPEGEELTRRLGVMVASAYRPAGLGGAFAWLDSDGVARFGGLDAGEWQAALLLFDPEDRVVGGGDWSDLEVEAGAHHELVLEWPFTR